MKSKALLTLILIVIISCSTKKEVARLYGKCCTQILLNPDKTFEYRTYLGVGGEVKRTGTWIEHKGDTILLNTLNQPKNKKTTYKGIVNPNLKNKIRISIRDFEMDLAFAKVEINDGQVVKVTDSVGMVEFEIDEIKNITYHYMGEISEKINIANPNYNDINILTRDIDLEIVPQYFTDQPIVATNRKVVFYPKENEKRFERKKTNLKNKGW